MKKTIIVLAAIAFLYSCKKDKSDPQTPVPINKSNEIIAESDHNNISSPTTGDSTTAYIYFKDAIITDSVIKYGYASVFMQKGSDFKGNIDTTSWYALPATIVQKYDSASTYFPPQLISYSFSYQKGSVLIRISPPMKWIGIDFKYNFKIITHRRI